MSRPTFRICQDLLLNEIYVNTLGSPADFELIEGETQTRKKFGIAQTLVEKALGGLADKGYVKRSQPAWGEKQDDTKYEITTLGLEYIEAQLDDFQSPIREWLDQLKEAGSRDQAPEGSGPFELGSSLLGGNYLGDRVNASVGDELELELGTGSEPSSIKIPAADRFVSINHNSEEFEKARKALDDVISAFHQDHYHENEFGKEKSVLLKTLEAGRILLDDTTVSLATLAATVFRPLKIIATRYEQGLVGALASTAFAALAHLFGFI